MTMTVRGPGGVTVNFPDGTDPATIDKVMRQATSGRPDLQSALDAKAAATRQTMGLPTPAGPKGDLLAPDTRPDVNYAAPPPDLSLGDVASGAAANFIPSAQRLGGDIWHALTNPAETLSNLGSVGLGVAEKAIPGEQPHEKYANAVGSFFADRYGGFDNLKRTMATDPVGFLADAASILSGGELALARAPGVLGEVSRAAGTVSRAVDPINLALQGAKTVGRGVGEVASGALGVSTGAGGAAFREAAQAGYEGGARAQAFTDSMRGRVPMEDAVASAKAGLNAIRQDRQAAYRAGMADLGTDQTILDFNKIDQTLQNTPPVKAFTGKKSGMTVSLQPSAQNTAADLAAIIDDWRKLPPEDFHTAEGLDALKQRLQDVKVEPHSPSEAIKTQVVNIVKAQILQQAPKYAATMRNYQQASDLIREIEGTLSLNRNARIDTQLRKLQSVMRNNVNTNYGRRVDLARLLEDAGATNLMARLAGQSLSSFEPRGLARAVAGLGGIATGTAGILGMNPATLPLLAGQLAAQSPRLMGEAAYGAGTLARLVNEIPIRRTAQGLYQLRALNQGTQP